MPVATNQGFASLIPKEGIDYRFVFYLAQSLKPVFSRLAAGTTFIEVSRREIRRVKVCIPAGPEERTRIGEILSAVDAALQSSRQELSRAILVKTALMQQLFTQGIPGRHVNLVETKLGLIPAKWEVRKLKKCGKWGSGGTPDRANVHFWGGAIPWVKSGEVDYNVITETEERITEAGAAAISGELLPRGTLLVAMYGAGVTRGKAALLGIDAYVNQAIAFFKGDEHTNNEWLLYWFERHYEVVRTFAGGANQDNLSQYLVKNLLVARPQIDEQLETVSILRGASEAIASVERKISALKRLRKSLLHNLVSGSVRVRV
jgi:type I restriction enzyme S subunit